MTNDVISYTMADGITITASREIINQLRKDRAEYARMLAAKASAEAKGGKKGE